MHCVFVDVHVCVLCVLCVCVFVCVCVHVHDCVHVCVSILAHLVVCTKDG